MNKKLVFRILGALASALIIAAVFIPFVSVKGYTASLWTMNKGSLYLPIIIIVFGVIGAIVFSLNIKTEFAYMSTGAVAFFAIMQTIDIINQGVFGTLSIGYYFLVVGALLTGVMAFLLNLKSKSIKVETSVSTDTDNQETMLDQIDRLYDDQTAPEVSPIKPIDNVVEPIQPINTVPVAPIQPQINPVEVPQPEVMEQPQVNPVLQSENQSQQPLVENSNTNQQQINSVSEQPQVNPVIQEFTVEPQVNPVVQEFSSVSQENTQEVTNSVSNGQFNPVIQEFNNVSIPNPVQEQTISSAPESELQVQPVNNEQIPLQQINNIPEQPQTNPVVQEFTNPGVIVNQKPSSGETDIFGQPINR